MPSGLDGRSGDGPPLDRVERNRGSIISIVSDAGVIGATFKENLYPFAHTKGGGLP